MAIITLQPDSLSLSSNLKRFVISSATEIRFKLSVGEILLIDESYSPDALGKIEIDIKEVVNSQLSLSIPTTDIFEQLNICKSFTAQIDETSIVFSAIRAGVENLAVSATEFLAQNFLTWQPQSKQVGYSQPEWLTYYAPVAGSLKVKFYLSDNTSVVQTLTALAAGSCISVNMMFSRIMALQAGSKQGYCDVWVENAAAERLTYIQRYIYKETETIDEHFPFENSLGGLDTAVFSGDSVAVPEVENVEGLFDEESVQLDGTFTRLFSKNSGWKSKLEAQWLWDFFSSKNRYKIQDGVLKKISLRESDIQNSSLDDFKSFSFKYRLSVDKGLLNIQRSTDPLPENLEITTPEGLFFLAPRLVEFPSYSEDDGLIPIQSPYIQSWFKISIGQLKADIKQSIMIDPAFFQYVLPKASDTVLGGIKVGSNLTIDPDGTLHAQNSYSLPVATIASLGGVMIGSNISVSAQGVISVAAPYVHPESHPASMIVSDTLRRFITDTQISNYDTAYNARHTHENKANLDSINQDLSKTSNVQFNNIIADGSIAFYGDVGSGSVPVGSLLDLSDIDPSLATAITGSPLVKLASGKWGPGSISIDLSNYFNKTDSDSRFAFKSHSHDYVSPTTFNSHTGDTVKHLTAVERTAWNGKEPALGNPDVDGKILSSSGGVRSWVSRYVLPIAAAAMLGGVMIGSNISVNGQGVISVAAPYSHPASHAASMIDTDATRRFISDTQLSNLADAYNLRHSHGNKANLDTINQDLSQTSNVKFNNFVADGSIAFYGGVGSGGTPVASLLDLSDIDASISTAATGTPLVKLINGKWGAGSISIDLSNYYNKTDSDARYAFKSHSHDYISPTTFNGHTSDAVKHITGTERSNWNTAYSYSQVGHLASSGGTVSGMTSFTGSAVFSNTLSLYIRRPSIDANPNIVMQNLDSNSNVRTLGYITMLSDDNFGFYRADGSTYRPVLHSGNFSSYADAAGAAATVQGNLNTHAYLTTTAHGLGGSAFHADSFFIQDRSSSAQSANLWISGTIRTDTIFQFGTTATMLFGRGNAITGGLGASDLLLYNTGGDMYLWATGGFGLKLAASTGAATFASTIQATTGKFTDLTSGYIPIYTSSGLANSRIVYDGTNMLIDVVNNGGKLIIKGNDDGSGQLILRGYADNNNWWELGRESASRGEFHIREYYSSSYYTRFVIQRGTGNFGLGYLAADAVVSTYKLAVNGSIYAASYVESASYLKGTSVKLGTWEIKENAQGDLEFIQSGTLRFKGTSLGLISQKTVAFYD